MHPFKRTSSSSHFIGKLVGYQKRKTWLPNYIFVMHVMDLLYLESDMYSCTLQFVLCEYSVVFFATVFWCSCNTSNKNFAGVNKVVDIVVTTITSAKVPIFYVTKAKIWCSKNASLILGQGLVIVM
jgi:hypothetical protein